MDSASVLSDLNDQQRAVVTAPLRNLLVLAGAGSGKTRVLVHRIAWLIQVENVSPYGILAVTFTNKAAGEMRNRIEQLLEMPVRGMWVGTFHSLAHRILRAHWQAAELPENFQILDSDDQYRMIRRVMKSLGVDEAECPPRKVQWFINNRKDEGVRPQHIQPQYDVTQKLLARIYEAYEAACERGGLVDFAEILLRAHELWLKHPAILQHYRERFGHILVDEFQDTNTIQYAWIRLLAADQSHVMIVGDDDQSIYGWRGAKVDNIYRFEKDFKGTQTIRLEQNYRSTGMILNAANALIAHNEGRFGKNLWTQGREGDPINVYSAYNEIDESRYIVGCIQAWHEQGNPLREAAVLYRSNAQSRVIEETLVRLGVAYRVYGGLRFFDRAEIKDVLAYLRMIINRHDDAAFERIINVPTRGIGEKTVAECRARAQADDCSLWRAATRLVDDKVLSARASNALVAFLEGMDELDTSTAELSLPERTEQVIQQSGLWEHYAKSKNEKAQSRLENMAELVTATKQYTRGDDDDLPELTSFLSHAALESGEHQGDAFQDCVQLMTLHSAKGLEFPLVIISGVEEGLFPNKMSEEEPGRLEEERRLCYVGITRAMQQLVLTHAEVRRLYGKEMYHRQSRFIREIPDEYLKVVRSSQPSPMHRNSSHMAPRTTASIGLPDDAPYKLGQLVRHAKFGEGVVMNFEGRGAHARVQVKFASCGVKWLVVSYANLEIAS